MKIRFSLEVWQLAVVGMVAVGYVIMLYSVLNGTPPAVTDMHADAAVGALRGASVAVPAAFATTATTAKTLTTATATDGNTQRQLAVALERVSDLDGRLSEARQLLKQHAEEPVLNAYTGGVVILGMHRSGTSMLGGLMNKMGLKAGGPLIKPANDNEKGFFERMDVVIMNDAIMAPQNIDYAGKTWRFNSTKGIMAVYEHIEKKSDKWFNEGRRALKFLNDDKNMPWMLKDPRLCITLRTWLPLLRFRPVIVFQYRHPLDVAQSLLKRYEHFRIVRTLKMWYVYNRRAVEDSHDLCRVVTSHKAVLADAKGELDRIYHQLGRCGLAVPHLVSLPDVAEFVDSKLIHGKVGGGDSSCSMRVQDIRPPDSVWPTRERMHLKLYQECMRVFCAMEDRSAFMHSFKWDYSIKDQ